MFVVDYLAGSYHLADWTLDASISLWWTLVVDEIILGVGSNNADIAVITM
jgi:hypothetical protein